MSEIDSLDKITKDPELQSFIELESQKQKYQQLVHTLTQECWDICMDKPSTRMDGKTETCLQNCVDRFIDTTNYVFNRVQKIPQNQFASGEDQEHLFN